MTHSAVTDSEISALVESLWCPDSDGLYPNVFALLDGARDRKIEPMLNQCGHDYQCLYSGNISYALKRAAPHIVHLQRQSLFTRKLLQRCWGNSWGIFAITPPTVELSKVRNNCRRMAKVEAPNGKTLIFRYYDPRVMRKFLPSCETNALHQVFGPVSTYAMESEDSGALLLHSITPTSNNLYSQLKLVKDSY